MLSGSASRGTTRPDRAVDVAILTPESDAEDCVDVALSRNLCARRADRRDLIRIGTVWKAGPSAA
jgi:predicted nucleotidyltransferase